MSLDRVFLSAEKSLEERFLSDSQRRAMWARIRGGAMGSGGGRRGNSLLKSLGGSRSFFYGVARLMGDVNAIARGKFLQRLLRKKAGRVSGDALNKLFR